MFISKSTFKFLMDYIFSSKLLYKSKCPSVRMSTTFKGKRPLLRYCSNFFVQNPLMNEHLFCKYFVRLSVSNATKGFATYGCCHPC